MAIAGSRPEFGPVVALEFLLQLDGLLDLLELDVDQFIVFVSLGMYVSQDLLCLLQSALGNEPTGRFGNGPVNSKSEKSFLVGLCLCLLPNENQLAQGWNSLQETRHTPRPCAAHDVVRS